MESGEAFTIGTEEAKSQRAQKLHGELMELLVELGMVRLDVRRAREEPDYLFRVVSALGAGPTSFVIYGLRDNGFGSADMRADGFPGKQMRLAFADLVACLPPHGLPDGEEDTDFLDHEAD